MWCSAYIYCINIIMIMHIQSNLHNMTIFVKPCDDVRSYCVFFVWSNSQILNKLDLVTKMSKCLGQKIMCSLICCHLVYQIITSVINNTTCYRILHNWGVLKTIIRRTCTHMLTHKLWLVSYTIVIAMQGFISTI